MWIRLTMPNDKSIYVNSEAMDFIRLPLAVENGECVIGFASGHIQAFKESFTEVISKIIKE
jgi:uncharacterized protein YlzI (FlbEa/FlbD family)